MADETQPLLAGGRRAGPVSAGTDTGVDVEAGLRTTTVEDDTNNDDTLDDPRAWPSAYKWGLVLLLALMAFTVTFTCISVVPVAGHIVDELDGGDSTGSSSSSSSSVLLVTIWELGEAAGPLAIAPLAETAAWGRATVLNNAVLLFALATAAAARCRGRHVGVAVGAVGEHGPGDGVLGEPAQARAAAAAAADVEGSGTVSPATTATTTNAEEEDDDGKPHAMAPDAPPPTSSGLRHIRDAVLRPAVVLADSFVLALLSLYGAVVFAFFYVMSVSLPGILEDRYGFSSAETGSAFLVFSFGAFISVLVCNRYLDPIYLYLTRTRGHLQVVRSADGSSLTAAAATTTRVGRPEFRLPLACVCALALPAVICAYGWTAEWRLPQVWLLLLLVGLMGTSMVLMMVPVAAYVVDAFGLYAASAMTGVIVSRCLCGTFLPLAVAPLVARYGYGWAFTVLAGVCLAVAPIPLVVYGYGERWRQRSVYTRDA
ncbi:Major facilitator superfamily domain, general substrate transporter [Niveomyces insectorum RCEF 264]|uniref:Major facilitator superfamily domain, general substrate transporter n=1 Tax=Niveomyces insectorum RCEF 264 TaxID=1081102 RepID=A0A167Q9L3_9HYPO|nr:Major facilitator superfamily domain, general substrate transporter [Niveomyces insectorum RCEF 264]